MQLSVRRAVPLLMCWDHTAACVRCANQDKVRCAWEYARVLYKRSTRRLDMGVAYFRRGNALCSLSSGLVTSLPVAQSPLHSRVYARCTSEGSHTCNVLICSRSIHAFSSVTKKY
jgi:hypothetical protein